MTDDGTEAREALNTEAAQWVVLLASGACDDATRQRFVVWRNSSPDHELAFEREQFAWERTERLRALRPADALDGHALRPSGVMESLLRSGAGALVRWRSVAIAASLVVAAGLATMLWAHATTQVYATQVGERRSVHLADGSRLELNTDTRVAVRMSHGSRHLELLQGESLFEVAHDTARPFIVAIGDSTVRAVGTAFNIRRHGSGFKVLVTEGIVDARGEAQGSAPAFDIRIPAGSTVAFGSRGVENHRASPEEQERMLAWRSGMVALAGETLGEAVAEFNRYNAMQLVVVDRGIGGIQLGGYFDAHDLDAFVKVLSTTFGVGAERAGDAILLRGTGTTASP
jgi:transmembrane sensor